MIILVWTLNVTVSSRTLDDRKVLVCDGNIGAEGGNRSSEDHLLASLSTISTSSTPSLLFHHSSLALFILVWQRNKDLDVVKREKS